MRIALVVLLTFLSVCFAAGAPTFPLASGKYLFQWRDAEFTEGTGFPVTVTIDGLRVVVVNDRATRPGVPAGELASGKVMWHSGIKNWIIGDEEVDRSAPSAGSCDDGPNPYVIDPKKREIWSCEWGP